MSHPYKGLEPRAFWKRSVGDRHYLDVTDLATPGHGLDFDDRIIAAGSCFALHIARHLRSGELGIFSARYLRFPPKGDKVAHRPTSFSGGAASHKSRSWR